MIDPQLLDILVCPETREPLQLAEAELVATVNAAIKKGELHNRKGEPVKEAIDGALLRSDGALLYPIRDEIPIMLVEEAIPLPLTKS